MRPILANMGLVLQLAGILIAFPIGMGFIYNESQAIIALFITSFSFFFFGFFLNTMSVREELDFKQSCILLTEVFVVMGIIGALPYIWLNAFNDTDMGSRILNSLFESVSGYTTTGFSLITDPDSLPRSLMFYRSFTHLIGGLGIVFLLLAFFYTGKTLEAMSQVMNFVRVTDNIKKSLLMILLVYSVYIALFSGVFYLLGFTNIADTISIVLSSLMTGGFSPVTNFSPYAAFPAGLIVMVMMVFGAISFIVHYRIITLNLRKAITAEFIVYLSISAISIVALMNLYPIDIFSTIFHVLSASSGTGFATIDFTKVPEKAKLVYILLMFIGGMSFSTAGGIKISRLMLFFKSIIYTLRNAIGNDDKDKIMIDGNEFGGNIIISNLVLVLVSVVIAVGAGVMFWFSGFGLVDSMFEVASAFGTVGLSTGIATQALAAHLKLSLIVLMIMGRVEAIPFFVSLSGLRLKTGAQAAAVDGTAQVEPFQSEPVNAEPVGK